MARLAPVLVLLALLASGAPQPAAAATASCTAHVTRLRYRPEITWACTAAVTSPTAIVRRVSSHAVVTNAPVPASGITGLALDLHTNLASDAAYSVTLTYDDGGTPASVKTTWRTLPPPAHPHLRVKFITAIPADAVLDIAHRMDSANLLAVPRASDFVDASARSLTAAQYASALRGHQSALVVTDEPVLNPLGLDHALATYCGQGHGVVLGGQTHWLVGNGGWAVASAVGGAGTRFGSKWAMFAYDDVFPGQVTTGTHQMAPGSVQHHFLTKGLKRFTVIGPGSGEPIIQDYSSGRMLATLQKAPDSSSPFHRFGQVLLSERQIGAGRVVDLGFRPWSSAVSNGGFDPAVSPGGSLTARSLWWATNRIPPIGTHFTTRPSNPSSRATVVFALAGRDADAEGVRALRFRYRVDGGRWRWAVGSSFVLYHLAGGSVHTVQAYAVDSGGNRDAHAARYTFRVLPGAIG